MFGVGFWEAAILGAICMFVIVGAAGIGIVVWYTSRNPSTSQEDNDGQH